MNLISHRIPSSEGLGVDLFHYLFPITSHHTPTLRGAWEGFIQRGLEAFHKKAGHPYVRVSRYSLPPSPPGEESGGEVLPDLLPHLPTAILDNDNLLRTARHRLSRCHHTRERVAAHSRLICSRSGHQCQSCRSAA